MRDRGKAVEDMEVYYSTSSHDLPCKKHPSSSSVGICAYCLKDRLIKLVCSDCGEQRLSSCSCSEISSNRNSCTVEVGSVGRVSFLIENDNTANRPSRAQTHKTENNNNHHNSYNNFEDDALFLRRSNSSCVEIKRSRNGGFWRFGKLFRKKKEIIKDALGNYSTNRSVSGFDHEIKSEMWLVDHVGVSRSRSLCSFRGGGGGGGGGWLGSDDGARSSISGARSSSVTACMVLDSGRRSGFSETEPRKSGFDGGEINNNTNKREYYCYSDVGLVSDQFSNGGGNRRVFSLKESDYFSGMDESGFIDLKLDYSAESKAVPDHQFCSSSESAFGSMRASTNSEFYNGGNSYNESENGVFSRGGSCRITVNDRGLKKGRKSLKGWKWIFRQHLGNSHGMKKDGDLMFKT